LGGLLFVERLAFKALLGSDEVIEFDLAPVLLGRVQGLAQAGLRFGFGFVFEAFLLCQAVFFKAVGYLVTNVMAMVIS
jgi:hypothetical protein